MWENEASFGSGSEVGDILKKRSGEGWELVSAMINPSSLIYAMFFKRKKELGRVDQQDVELERLILNVAITNHAPSAEKELAEYLVKP